MAIAKGNTITGTFSGNGSVTHNLSSGSGNNRLVVVAFTYADYGSAVPSAVTYGGTAMTLYDTATNSPYKTKYYYLLDSSLPSTSGNKTVSVTYSSSPNAGGTAIVVCDYTGVAQQVPEAGNKASSSTPVSCSLTTLTANACVIAIGGGVHTGSNIIAGNSATMDAVIGDYTAQCSCGISEYTKVTAGSNTSSFSSSYGALNIISASWAMYSGGGGTQYNLTITTTNNVTDNVVKSGRKTISTIFNYSGSLIKRVGKTMSSIFNNNIVNRKSTQKNVIAQNNVISTERKSASKLLSIVNNFNATDIKTGKKNITSNATDNVVNQKGISKIVSTANQVTSSVFKAILKSITNAFDYVANITMQLGNLIYYLVINAGFNSSAISKRDTFKNISTQLNMDSFLNKLISKDINITNSIITYLNKLINKGINIQNSLTTYLNKLNAKSITTNYNTTVINIKAILKAITTNFTNVITLITIQAVLYFVNIATSMQHNSTLRKIINKNIIPQFNLGVSYFRFLTKSINTITNINPSINKFLPKVISTSFNYSSQNLKQINKTIVTSFNYFIEFIKGFFKIFISDEQSGTTIKTGLDISGAKIKKCTEQSGLKITNGEGE